MIRIRSDAAPELIKGRMEEFSRQTGIQLVPSCPYTSNQNEVIERANWLLLEKARTLMIDSDLPREMWVHAYLTAIYLINQTPTRRLVDKLPQELWARTRKSLNHLRPFGCRV